MTDEPIDLNAFRAEKETDGWRDQIQLSNHKPIGNEFNIHLALTECPAFKGLLAFDRRLLMPVTSKRTPAGPAGVWSDAHTARMAIWLQSQGIQTKPHRVDAALLAAAYENEIDPLEEYLLKIEWDGQERIGTWFRDYAQAPDNPAISIMGSKFLIGAVARAMKPGCRMDYMPVLEGIQGAKKSTLIKILGGDYAGENLPDFHSKDAMLIAATKWIIEVSELAAVRKSDLEHVKAFITRTEDTLRAPYGRYIITQPRRCVLIGNLNPDGNGYLQDMTGNRRFWPIPVGQIDTAALKRDRDQLWAEAMYCYLRGDHWWPDQSEAELVAQEQQARLIEDPWAAAVEAWAKQQIGTFSTSELCKGALDMDVENVNRGISIRIGILLKSLGYLKKRVREGSQLNWVYFLPDS